MRGGNRQHLEADGVTPPPPPRGLDPDERALWKQLAAAVEALGTYQATDEVAFRRLVRNVYRAEVCPLDAAPSAAGRLEQSAKSALESFGLTPMSRQRVAAAPKPKTVVENYLAAVGATR